MKRRVISDLADINPPTSTAHLSAGTEVSFIPMSDVDERGRWTRRQVRLRGEIGPGYTPFQDGDVLVAKITPCLENGKGAHVHGLASGVGFGSTEFHVLRAKPGVDPRYLFQITQDARFRLRAAAQMEGSAGQQRVPSRFFYEYEVPDLDGQKQAFVGHLLTEADVAIEKARAELDKLARLKAGLMQSLLSGPVRIPDGPEIP